MVKTNAGNIEATLTLDHSGFSNGINSAMQQLQTFSNSANGIGDRLTGLGSAMTSIGGTLTKGVTLPLMGAGAAITKFAIDYETSLAKVSTIADTTTTSMEKISDGVKKLSNEFGIAATDLNESIYQALSAGVDTEGVLGFTEEAIKLSKAGFADVGSTVDVLTTIMNAYKMEVSEVAKISDILIGTQNLGKTTVGELGTQIGRVIPTANAYGVSLEQLSAAYVMTTKNGVSTAESTTYLNAMINELGKSSTKVSGIIRNKTGKTFKELMDSGMSLGEVLNVVNEGAKESNVSLGDLFGSTEAAKAALILTKGEGEEFAGVLKELTSSAGSTDDAFNKVSNTTKEKLAKSFNRLKNAGIELGTNLLPVVADFTEGISKMVEKFNGLDDGTKKFITNTGLVAAAIGPVLSISGKLITGVGGMIKAFSLLSTGASGALEALGGLGSVIGLITGPIGIATGVIVAAVVAWKTNFAGFRDACKSIFEDLGRIFKTLKDRYINLWNDIKDAWDGDLGGIQTMLTTGWENVTTVFESTFKAIADIFDLFADAFEGDWNGVWENVFSITNELMDGFQEAWSNSLDAMISVLENWFPSLEGKLDKLPDIFNKVWGFIQEGMNIGIENIRLTFEAIGKIFDGDFGGAFELFKGRWSDAWDTIVKKVGKVKDSIKEKLPEIKEAVTTNLADAVKEAGSKAGEIKTAIVDKFNTIKDDVGEKLSGLKDTVSNKLDDAKKTIEDKKTEISEAMGKLFESAPEKIGHGLGFAIESVKNWASNLYETMSTKIPEIVGNIGTWFGELPSKVSKLFDETKSKISTWGSDVIKSVGDSLKELPNKISEWFDKGVKSIDTWATNAIKSAKKAGSDIVNGVIDGFKELPRKMFEFGMSIPQTLWNGIKSSIGLVKDFFGGIFDGLFDGFNMGEAMADFVKTFNGYMDELGGSVSKSFGSIVNDLETGAINVERFGISVEQYLAGAISTMSDMGVSAEDLAAAIMQIPEEKRAEVITILEGEEGPKELKDAIDQVKSKEVNVNANVHGRDGVTGITRELNGIPLSKNPHVNATVSGDGQVVYLKQQLNSLHDVNVHIRTFYESYGEGGTGKIMHGTGPKPSRAATGTENANSGLYEVAEYGPELIMSRSGAGAYLAIDRQRVNMEGGERVFNARQTNDILKSMTARSGVDNNSKIEKILYEVSDKLNRLKEISNNVTDTTKAIENKKFENNVTIDGNSLAKGITPSVEKEQGNRMLLYKRGVLV